MRVVSVLAGGVLGALLASSAFGASPEPVQKPVVSPDNALVAPATNSGLGSGALGAAKPADEPKVAALIPELPQRVKRPPPPPVTLRAVIDLRRQQMTVQEYGKTLYSWKISSGRDGYRTPPGKFRPQWRSKMWYSRQYDNSPMPYAVFFNGGIATHGTSAVSRLGRPASHGCIRLTTGNAKRFYTLVAKHGNASTRIVVTGSAPGVSNRVAKREKPRSRQRASGRNVYAQSNRRNAQGLRYVRTPYGYNVYYDGSSRRNRYSSW
ncbi:MAG: hypothetical protein RLZ98_917 [Pseudomonadota bacterium]|jgi:lipoprotein-anchoring transpeptidase ErfK/SrfK